MKKSRKHRKDLLRLATFLKKESARLAKALSHPYDEGEASEIGHVRRHMQERHLQSMADLVTVLSAEAALAADKESSKKTKSKTLDKKPKREVAKDAKAQAAPKARKSPPRKKDIMAASASAKTK